MGRGIKRFAGKMSQVDEVVKLFYHERPWDLPRAVCWHLLGYSMGILQAWLFFGIVVPENALGYRRRGFLRGNVVRPHFFRRPDQHRGAGNGVA